MRPAHPLRGLSLRALGVAIAFALAALWLGSASKASAQAAPQAHASAQSVNLALAGGALTLELSANGGTQAHNDGDDSIAPVHNTPLVSLLGGQNLIVAGALSETAEADIDGSSYACAGILSPGGTVEIGNQGQECTPPATARVAFRST